MTQSAGHDYLRTHEISGKALLIDVDREAEEILNAAKQEGTGHTAKTLVKEGPLRIVLLGLKQGSTLRDHEAEGPVSLHVLKGDVEIASGESVETVEAGRALVFGASVSHSVRALADSVVLVTIAWPQT